MNQVRTEPRPCWSCGASNDGHTAVLEPAATPASGDLGICLYCHRWGIFTEDGTRPLSPDDWAELAADRGHVARMAITQGTLPHVTVRP